MYNFRTDLALERRDIYKKANNIADEVDGLETEEEKIGDDILVSRVKVLNEQGEKSIGKPKGTYITIDVKNLKIAREEEISSAASAVTNELRKILDEHIQKQEDILVVGLGNESVTPDALGPKVIDDIDITRHLINYVPQYVKKGTRPVSAISPGVLGTTGIETQEILKGIVENVKPKLLIIIDALASRSIERISSTVQIADTGIVPGAGVGNTRKELSQKSLGVPVIAIGVPTVVEAATIAADSLDIFVKKMEKNLNEGKGINGEANNIMYDLLKKIDEEDKYEMIKEVLIPEEYNFIVTPKEIDDLILNMSSVIARGINFAIQEP